MPTNKELLAKIEALEAQIANRPSMDHLMSESDAIRKTNPVAGDSLPMNIIHDHKNVRLYHTNGHQIGKFVGPLHPHNAQVELQRFARRGIKLSTIKPTDAEIAAYKETKEWKDLDKAFQKKRAAKIKKRKNQDIDALAKAIEKLSGQKVTNAVSEIPV